MKVFGYKHDTLLKAGVISPQLPKKLDFLLCLETHAERWKTEFRNTTDSAGSKRFREADPEERGTYNAKDAYQTDVLDDIQEIRLQNVHNGRELYQTYLNLNVIGIKMKRAGVRVIPENFAHHRKTLARKRRNSRNVLQAIADGVKFGGEFKPTASKHVKRLFLECFGLPPTRWSEQTGEPSVDKNVLTSLCSHPQIEIRKAASELLKFRKWSKLLSSYVVNMPIGKDGRVHPSWNVSGAKTGRWSCQDPSMQVIPKPIVEKLKNGKTRVAVPGLRDLFGPSVKGETVNGLELKKDNELVEVDFKAFESFTLALMSGDKTLLDWLKGDAHTKTAKYLFQYTDEQWTTLPKAMQSKFREMAKRMRYALHYRSTPETAWRALVPDFHDLTLAMVLRVWKQFSKLHPDIVRWQEEMVRFGQKHKYIECPLDGRRFVFWGEVEPSACANLPNQMMVAAKMNKVIQLVDAALEPGEQILGQIHDAILAEGPDAKKLAAKIKEICERPEILNGVQVSFPVDAKWSPTDWGHMEEVKF